MTQPVQTVLVVLPKPLSFWVLRANTQLANRILSAQLTAWSPSYKKSTGKQMSAHLIRKHQIRRGPTTNQIKAWIKLWLTWWSAANQKIRQLPFKPPKTLTNRIVRTSPPASIVVLTTHSLAKSLGSQVSWRSSSKRLDALWWCTPTIVCKESKTNNLWKNQSLSPVIWDREVLYKLREHRQEP